MEIGALSGDDALGESGRVPVNSVNVSALIFRGFEVASILFTPSQAVFSWHVYR